MLIKQTTQMTDSEKIAAENSNNQFLQSLSFVAVGTIYPFAGSTIPDTFLLCDGSALDITEYSELFSVIGYTYGGSGDSFNIPDLRGKVLVGCDSSDTSFNALGKKGGAKEVKLTVAQMPKHSHGGMQPNAGSTENYGWHMIETAQNYGTVNDAEYEQGASRGGDQPHENMPPYMVCNYIIKVNQGISTDDFRLPIDQTYTPTSPNAQSGIATAEAIKSSKTYANNTFAPAIKNTVSGSVLAVHDVSPVEHALNIKLSSDTLTDFSNVGVSRLGKNLFNTSQELTEEYCVKDIVISENSISFTKNSGAGSSASITQQYYLAKGKYTFSGEAISSDNMIVGIAIIDANNQFIANYANKGVNFTFEIAQGGIYSISLYTAYLSEVGTMVTYSNIQLELGTKATEYELYISPKIAIANADGTVEGLTSLSPDMTVTTDTEGVVIDMTYNADTKMYIDNKLAEISTAIVNNV